ncbi:MULTISPECIES: DegT/DnrJ/EryC1/StrS family aminotransferase [unclassified Moorena]|uniref:DegT/DnrJ/EryC1/StrS family aminotransferase n=1 Tax=unclassified Moorena TaxID=2683338 RepID=UPI0013BFEFDF|nr:MULTISPECIES: DegT/DnrJ/EryC1/StrS family aminotransferase [unclassified Moorena]NEP36795.1 DegT/DnrJ/EryC1/StrS family aminotransferase [Moorena sp. SIO3B2]NEQ12944.1 DegT/DnrJ/EryC1/StrS family aminotransferase [Moorena sp. SIO3E2]NET68341.1 DegT/DnrJ/EryC1/StrS family aminotransferase [Moorena sp. SIO1G6]
MNTIPPLDLKRQYQVIGEQVSAAVGDVLSSGRYIGGPVVEHFEQQFAAYTGTLECIGCNSGTDALYLALRALDIGPGDEVITTPFTFIATAEVIAEVGATPVFVDINAETFNIDLNQIEKAITHNTRAIIPVHLFGQPVHMTAVMDIAKTHCLAVIEDCAQGTGAEWVGKKVGSIGHIGCFSFYPTKNLGTCGDGGAVTTNDKTIAASIRMLRDHGRCSGYYHQVNGINSRLDALQAAILNVKLPYLDGWNNARRQVATRYHQLLEPLPEIILPRETPGGNSVWNQYTIRLTQDSSNSNYRDEVRQKLKQAGISSMVYYPLPLHLQPVYKDLGYQIGQFPVAEQVCHEVLSLPMFPELTVEEQQQVVYGLKDCLG